MTVDSAMQIVNIAVQFFVESSSRETGQAIEEAWQQVKEAARKGA